MSRRVAWQPRALRDLGRLDRQNRERVVEAVQRFAATGHGNVVRLTAVTPPEYRLRVGDWRVRFAVDDDSIVVLHVRNRGDAYR